MSEKCGCAGGCPGDVQAVSTSLSFGDVLGGWKFRRGIGRMAYRVAPGLYAVGEPGPDSPVLVSANFKLTFDTLRKNLTGMDCWLLILDTRGVNVWCAAGKGTFGTEELIARMEAVGLPEAVAHRRLILPQLGAPGVSAQEVQRRTGFSVVYGPVRAADIKEFIASGSTATKAMREVTFPLRDRLALTAYELMVAARVSMFVFGVLFLLNLFAVRPFGVQDFVLAAGAVLVGAVVTPALLPLVPGRAFAWKGWLLGLCWTALMLWRFSWFAPGMWLLAVGCLLLFPSVSAYLALNFTGCSTFTSPSGVLKEMKAALPPIVASTAVGTVLILVHRLIG